MKRNENGPSTYVTPRIETLDASRLVESLGPVSAGSRSGCAPMLGNFCL